MEPLINQIHKLLLKNKKTIAVAESCTGGILCGLLTQNSGSSQYFILGTITYSNKAKEEILKIPSRIIHQEGAVSKSVAGLMAQNVRKLAKTDFGIGLTGIAGPKGGTPFKPVGSVFIAIAAKNSQISKKFHFSGTRNAVRKKAALKALELLYARIHRN